jgi:hypothetical protein
MVKPRLIPLVVCLAPLLMASCKFKGPVEFPVHGTGAVLYARSREAASGTLSFSKVRTFEYEFDKPLPVPPDAALEVEYRIPGAREGRLIRLTIEGVSWTLPLTIPFLGARQQPDHIRYALPLAGPELQRIVITLEQEAGQDERRDSSELPGIELRSLGLGSRWLGFAWEDSVFAATPFVHQDGPALIIDPPEQYRLGRRVELAAEGVEGRLILEAAGKLRYTYALPEGLPPERFFVPAGALPGSPYPISLTGDRRIASLRLTPASPRRFPGEPVSADPGIVMDYPQGAWRDPRYELFRWDRFPSVLIFDTADYAVQDRLLKRLAFFVEKAGFRGRLASDEEMADLHGWYAHDYRAEDLARFFETARKANFPLSAEERELAGILVETGIIRDTGVFEPGEGAIISISRESSDYLRNLFMVHEGFHGIFFIDDDFQDFSRRRWEGFSPAAKRFILSYFDYQRYDTGDAYLMVNEFMAYCLQQSASLAGEYFGKTLAGRLETTWRGRILPSKDEPSGTWPEIAQAFSREAALFSSYVDERWGLAAGRIGRVTVKYLP